MRRVNVCLVSTDRFEARNGSYVGGSAGAADLGHTFPALRAPGPFPT